MKKLWSILSVACLLTACKNKPAQPTSIGPNKQLASLFDNYYSTRSGLLPMEATMNGDNRFNDRMPAEFTDSYRQQLTNFFTAYLDSIKQFNRDGFLMMESLFDSEEMDLLITIGKADQDMDKALAKRDAEGGVSRLRRHCE